MSEYLILAENITFKNNKLSCINIYDRFTSVAMPAEFKFDMAVICGPNWKTGEHKLSVKARANTGVEVNVGELTVNIPNDNFVYNAYAQDLKIVMDYSIQDLTFIVYDDEKEIINRKYAVLPLLVPQKQEKQEKQEETQKKNKTKAKELAKV